MHLAVIHIRVLGQQYIWPDRHGYTSQEEKITYLRFECYITEYMCARWV